MNSSRRTFSMFFVSLTIVAGISWADRDDDANRKSKNGELSGLIDGVAVTIEYGRPNVKDRKIWGGLVPWDQVWRAGADEATTIRFDGDVRIQGDALPAGHYAFFALPGRDKWTLVFNNTPDQWGAFSYDPNEDALRVDAIPDAADHVEELTFSIEGSAVVLRWEKLAVAFGVEADD